MSKPITGSIKSTPLRDPPGGGTHHTGIVWSATFRNVPNKYLSDMSWKVSRGETQILEFEAYEVFIKLNDGPDAFRIDIRFNDRGWTLQGDQDGKYMKAELYHSDLLRKKKPKKKPKKK